MKKRKYKPVLEKSAGVSEPSVPYGYSSGEGHLTFEKVWKMFQESDRKFQEDRKEMKEQSQETDRQFKETDKKIKKLADLFSNQWGSLIESLVEGKLLEILNRRGIRVKGILQRADRERDGKIMEIDLTAVNDTDVVVVEVKTTLTVKKVDDFIIKLEQYKTFFHEYKNFRVMGAVAFLKRAEAPERYAQSKGLFTIRATGDSATITNLPDFKPVVF